MGYQKIIINGREVVDFAKSPKHEYEVVNGAEFYDRKGNKLVGKLQYNELFTGNVTDLYIPSGVERLTSGQEYLSGYFDALHIPASIKSIDANTFYNCSYNTGACIYMEDINEFFKINFNVNGEYEYGFAPWETGYYGSVKIFSNNMPLDIVHMPNGMTQVPYNFFSGFCCSELKLADTITKINTQSFYEARIPRLILPNSITDISSDAFQSSHIYEIYNPSNVDISNYSGLENTIIHTSLDEESILIFTEDGYVKNRLTNEYLSLIKSPGEHLIIPSDMEIFPTDLYTTFSDDIKTITITDKIKAVQGDTTFYNLQKINLVGNLSQLLSIDYTDYGNDSLSQNANNPVDYYINGKLLEELVIPEDIESMSSVLIGCGSVKKITCLNPNMTLARGAFSYCVNLEHVVLPENLTDYKGYCERCPRLKELILPDGVVSLPSMSLYGMHDLIHIHLGAATEYKDKCNWADRPENLLYFTVSSENPYYAVDEQGILYNKDYTKLIQYPVGKTDKIYETPSTVKIIGDYALAGAANLRKIVFGDAVTTLGAKCCDSCSNLLQVVLGKNIGTSSFPSNNNSGISYGVFGNCHKLVEAYVLNSSLASRKLTYIQGPMIWTGQVKHTSLSEPSVLENVNGFVFGTWGGNNYLLGYCGDETNITLPLNYKDQNYVLYAENYSSYHYSEVFTDDKQLVSITFEENITSIPYTCIHYCDKLENLTFKSQNLQINQFGIFQLQDDHEIQLSKPFDINFYAKTAPILTSGSSINVSNDIITTYGFNINIPVDCANNYYNATNWAKFKDYIKEVL